MFYDTIAALQEKLFRKPLKRVLDIIQLSEFGDIDPDITFEFEPLHELTREQLATLRKTEAETDQIYAGVGAVTNNEVCEKLAADPDSPYSRLDLRGDIDIDDDEALFDDDKEEQERKAPEADPPERLD